jgi:hypothetical protein
MELKLAAGMTAPHRLRDLADVLELIRVNGLPADSPRSSTPTFVTSTWSCGRRRRAEGARHRPGPSKTAFMNSSWVASV